MHDPSNALLFIDIVEQGSISAAARAHSVSRATAARRLAALEESLGVQLITRTTHALSLTVAGEAYLPHALAMRASLARAEDAAMQAVDRPQGLLRLGAPIINNERFLLPLLRDFSEAYPDIDIELVLDADVRNLVSEGFDAALQVGLEHNAELIMRRLLIDKMLLAAAPAYLERRSTPRDLGDLERHDCLMLRAPDGQPTPWLLGDGKPYTPPRVRFLSNSFDLVFEMMLAGMGIARIPWAVGHDAFERGECVQVLPEVAHEEWFSLVYSATRIIPPKVRVLIDFATRWTEAFMVSPLFEGEER